ncbi:MAG: hypothetical protein K1060chlam2_00528 [Chlamydiae bacterium]|nr:hypothetical protein [Chlamydiota bacterium]
MSQLTIRIIDDLSLDNGKDFTLAQYGCAHLASLVAFGKSYQITKIESGKIILIPQPSRRLSLQQVILLAMMVIPTLARITKIPQIKGLTSWVTLQRYSLGMGTIFIATASIAKIILLKSLTGNGKWQFPLAEPEDITPENPEEFNSELPSHSLKRTPPKTVVRVSVGIGAMGEIPPLEILPIAETALRRWPEAMYRCGKDGHRGIKSPEKRLGFIASGLRHGGNAMPNSYEENPDGCGKIVIKDRSIEICFPDEGYAEEVSNALKAIGCPVDFERVNMIPTEEDYEHYRGAVVFNSAKSFLFFAREICQQSYPDVRDILKKHRTRHKDKLPTILSELTNKRKNLSISYNKTHEPYKSWRAKRTQLVGNHLSIPEKIWATDPLLTIGATSSLLVPGYKSLRDAREYKNIVHATLSADRGLSLYFPAEKGSIALEEEYQKASKFHGQRTQQALKKVKLSFNSEDLTTKPFNEKGQNHFFMLYSRDPETIVRYLLLVCKLTREEVEQIVKTSSINGSKLGKDITNFSKRRIEGEEDYYRCYILDQDFKESLNGITLNSNKFVFEPLPDLPEEARNINIDRDLRRAFQLLPEQAAGELGYDYPSLKRGIEDIINVVNGGNHSGLPHEPRERERFRDNYRIMLKHILYLLEDVKKDRTKEDSFLARTISVLANGGTACIGKHVQGMLNVYNAFKPYSTSAIYHSVRERDIHGLPTIDAQVIEIIETHLNSLEKETLAGERKYAFDAIAESHRQRHGGDLSHLKNHILKQIGRERNIPGAELADYEDPYVRCGGDPIHKDTLLALFDSRYNSVACESILKEMHEKIQYEKAESVQKVFDFLKYHASEEMKEDPSEFFDENRLSIKKKYWIQILIITDYFSTK